MELYGRNLQGREIKIGNTVYIGRIAYQIVKRYIDEAVGLLNSTDGKYKIFSNAEFQEFCRWNPQIIPNDKVPRLLEGTHVGDVLFSTIDDDVTVTSVCPDNTYPILVSFCKTCNSKTYTYDGKWSAHDRHPSLFKSRQQAAEYFEGVKKCYF